MRAGAIALALGALPVGTLAVGLKPGNYTFTLHVQGEAPERMQRCLTQADLDQHLELLGDDDRNLCKLWNVQEAAGRTTFNVSCKDGSTASGAYKVGETGLTGKTLWNDKAGMPRETTITMSARRIGDCKK